MSELEDEDQRMNFIANYVLRSLRVKQDKINKLLSIEENRKIFTTFFDDIKKPSIFISLLPSGFLSIQLNWPGQYKGKGCYFVKKEKEVIKKDTVMRQALIFGDMSAMPLDQLYFMVDEVRVENYTVDFLSQWYNDDVDWVNGR